MTILVVMGVSGSGKTTIGQALARRLGYEFIEGDEFHYSDLIARRFGSEHHRIKVDTARAIEALPGTVKAMSEPMMSHDAIGFYLLAQEVSKYVKVAQSGQGADEIFGGYHWYPALMRSNDATEDYARVYFDRDHAEIHIADRGLQNRPRVRIGVDIGDRRTPIKRADIFDIVH